MSTSYEDIFTRFQKRIEAPEFLDFDDTELEEQMTEWLDTALAYLEADQLSIKNDLYDRDNDTQTFTATLSNLEKELIAAYMVVAWCEPKIFSLEHIVLEIGTKDEKWTSQKEHLTMLKELKESTELEARKRFRNYGYKINSYLGTDV